MIQNDSSSLQMHEQVDTHEQRININAYMK